MTGSGRRNALVKLPRQIRTDHGHIKWKDSLDWHFELADAVVDRMMVREVYRQKGPRGPERRERLNSIAIREQEIARAFSDFAAHFVRHYSK